MPFESVPVIQPCQSPGPTHLFSTRHQLYARVDELQAVCPHFGLFRVLGLIRLADLPRSPDYTSARKYDDYRNPLPTLVAQSPVLDVVGLVPARVLSTQVGPAAISLIVGIATLYTHCVLPLPLQYSTHAKASSYVPVPTARQPNPRPSTYCSGRCTVRSPSNGSNQCTRRCRTCRQHNLHSTRLRPQVALVRQPRQLYPLRPSLQRPNPILPVVIRHKVACHQRVNPPSSAKYLPPGHRNIGISSSPSREISFLTSVL